MGLCPFALYRCNRPEGEECWLKGRAFGMSRKKVAREAEGCKHSKESARPSEYGYIIRKKVKK